MTDSRFLTVSELAKRAGVSRQAVYKAIAEGRAVKDETTGKIDMQHSTNQALYESLLSKQFDNKEDITEREPDEIEPGMTELYRQKLQADVDYKTRQTHKLDLQIAREKKDLVPINLMAIWMGYIATGIRNNFLQIGNKIARGDRELRDRIESEVSRSIESTIKNAESQLRSESEKIARAMEDME